MNRDELNRTLAEFRAALAEAEERAHKALSEADAYRQIVEGLEALAAGQLPLEEALPITPRLGSENGTAAETGPRGKEAVHRILAESDRSWKIPALAFEIKRRGWITPDAKNPKAAVNRAVERLMKDGRAIRVGPGLYRAAPSPFVPAVGVDE